MPLEKVRKVLKIAKEPVSLETPVGDEEDSSLETLLKTKCSNPLDTAIQSNLSESTTKILASLTPRRKSAKNALWNWNEYRSYIGRGRFQFSVA